MKRFWNGWSRIWCVTALVGWLAPAGAAWAGDGLGAPAAPGEAGTGALLLAGPGGLYAAAPMLETDVAIAVTGVIVRARVTQRFFNPSDDWLEAVYVFPLPDTAAVDQLLLLVGPRVIEGQIHEREAARRVYEAARASGRKASLLEQERPNIFTTSVANIGPRETVQVTIEYQDTTPFDGAQFALRFPLVVAPRYTGDVASDSTESPAQSTSEPSQFTALSPCTLSPNSDDSDATSPAVRLTVDLDPGFALAALYSPSHAILTEAVNPFVQVVSLADERVPADRDFELVWTPAAGAMPHATILAEEHEGELYALLTLLPPSAATAATRMAREMIFVIDTSGSMAGQSIEQAKLALLIALDALDAADHFNVIQFNSVTDQLFEHSVQASADHLERARAYVDGLQAGGGTEMEPALIAALADPTHAQQLKQIVFVTDGAVANEEALFAYLAEHLGASRLFTVGIGSAPNAYFMRKIAQFGRGTFTFIGSPQDVSARMGELFRKLERPSLADVMVEWGGVDAECWPNPMPDLYAGEPVVVAVRLLEPPDTVTVSGRIGDREWQATLDRPPLEDGGGIRQLWARRKIDALMDGLAAGADRDAVRDAVVDLAIEHHLVSAYTSLVAVDVTPSAPGDARLLTRPVPVNAPHGSVLALPATATPAPLYAVIALTLLFVARLTRRAVA